jgi:hypothetical protein
MMAGLGAEDFDPVAAFSSVVIATPVSILLTWYLVKAFLDAFNSPTKHLPSKTPSPVKFIDSSRLIGEQANPLTVPVSRKSIPGDVSYVERSTILDERMSYSAENPRKLHRLQEDTFVTTNNKSSSRICDT